MKNYRELEIYQLSYALAIKVHWLSLKLPKYELYEEGSQVRKSSKGIVSCIVEGYGRRRYKADFTRFLIYAHASCDETITHLNLIQDTHSLVASEIDPLMEEYEVLGAKINKFIAYVEDRWR